MFGTIFDYNKPKGYGFITLDSDRRVFFHISNYNGESIPSRGMRVEFDLAESKTPGKPDMAVRIISAEGSFGGRQ